MTDSNALGRRIENLIDAMESFGYAVTVDPIDGKEEIFVAHLKDALAKVEERSSYLRKKYGLREKSNNLLSMLHDSLPSPVWGVEVREPAAAPIPR